MKKPAFQVYLERIMQEQRAASDKARIAYEQSGDPQVVIGYIKHSLSGAAIKEPWVILTIQNWICSDRGDLLKQAFLTRRGERRKPRKHALDSMMFVTRIDKLRKAGKALNEALICELERTGGGDLEGDKLSRELRKLKNRYYRARRIKPEITVQETAEAYVMTAFPAKSEVEIDNHIHAIYGYWSISFPKK